MENKIKLIGVVDWFHDKMRDANYGFVKHPIIGEHYFNERLIDPKTNLKDLTSDTVVTFFSRESSHKKGTYEAFDVCLLDNENDIKFFISEFINTFLRKASTDIGKIKNAIKKKIRSYFENLSTEILKEELVTFEKLIANRIIGKDVSLQSNDITEIVAFIYEFDEDLARKIEKDILEKADKGTVFNLWMDGRVSNCDINYISELFFTLEFYIQEKVILKLEPAQSKQVLLHQIYTTNTTQNNIISLIKLIDKCDENECPELMDALLSENKSFFSKDFWISDLGISNIVFSHSVKSNLVRNSILQYNKSFIQKELNEELFLDLLGLKKLFEFIKENLSENLTILKEEFANKVNIKIAHELWLNEILDTCQIDYVAQILYEIDEKEKKAIFSKCTSEEKSNILFKSILNLDLKSNNFQYSSLQVVLSTTYAYAPEIKHKILSEVISNIPEYYKLNLWLDDYCEDLDYDLYRPYVITLSTDEQRLFVKKVFKYIHEGRISLELNDLTSLNVMDYDTSIAVQKIDGSKLDFSTSIVLNTLKELRDNNTFEETTIRSKIIEIIINQIKNPEDLLEIKGYFDKCAGRCRVHKNEKTNNEGETIVELSYERNSDDFPRMHIYCDARKSPNLHETTNKEFWWCANLPCHEISRQLHTSEDWRNYSLMDFLHILKIDYNEIDLELYLGVINKLNRFLSHMSCRECKEILRPKGQSNYAFYRVSLFSCQKEGCLENGKDIYINHCNNGRCGETIDSRDSVKCSPEGFSSEKCGWYICQNCHSCCTTSGIQSRATNLRDKGIEYVCHTEGHKDQGIMFCNQCGGKMKNSKSDPVKRKAVIDFFTQHASNSQIVEGSAKRPKDGGWWFKFAKGQLTDDQYQLKLRNLTHYGFNVPNIGDRSLTVQFVSEPFANRKEEEFIICSNSQCGKTIKLSENIERERAITRFHTNIFPNV